METSDHSAEVANRQQLSNNPQPAVFPVWRAYQRHSVESELSSTQHSAGESGAASKSAVAAASAVSVSPGLSDPMQIGHGEDTAEDVRAKKTAAATAASTPSSTLLFSPLRACNALPACRLSRHALFDSQHSASAVRIRF
jgi:hypothetical protein